VSLYFGAQDEGKMAYQGRFSAWESNGIKVTPVMSQPTGSWKGCKGYIQEHVKVSDGANTAVVLCGQKEMVQGAKDVLIPMGVPETSFILNF